MYLQKVPVADQPLSMGKDHHLTEHAYVIQLHLLESSSFTNRSRRFPSNRRDRMAEYAITGVKNLMSSLHSAGVERWNHSYGPTCEFTHELQLDARVSTSCPEVHADLLSVRPGSIPCTWQHRSNYSSPPKQQHVLQKEEHECKLLIQTQHCM